MLCEPIVCAGSAQAASLASRACLPSVRGEYLAASDCRCALLGAFAGKWTKGGVPEPSAIIDLSDSKLEDCRRGVQR